MNRDLFLRPAAVAAALLLAFTSTVLAAQGEPTDGWKDTAEFSYVVTGGNSETQTLGFKNKLWRKWDRSGFELSAGGVRAESTTTAFTAFGTPGNFDVDEQSDTSLTAEAYYLRGRYDRTITERFFWFGSVGWDRNRFAGIDDRYQVAGGVGNIWADSDHLKFRTDYSLTYTKQDDVFDNPDFDDTFLGARFSWAYLHKFGTSTTYTNDFVVDENLDETSDFRADMINAVAVGINQRLALKVSLQAVYDNEPSLREVDLFDTPGGVKIGTVLVELDELDTIFTASLVVNFL